MSCERVQNIDSLPDFLYNIVLVEGPLAQLVRAQS